MRYQYVDQSAYSMYGAVLSAAELNTYCTAVHAI